MEEISRFKRSACAVAYLFCFSLILFSNQPGAFGRFVGHVHKAFWCAVIELAVLAPLRTITYLSDLRPEPRIFQRLQDFVLNTLLAEAICSSTVLWVQLFVAHGSLSPFPASTPSTLGPWMSEVVGAPSQCVAFLCIIQIVYDINAVLRMSQDTGLLADIESVFDDEPFFAKREDFVSAVLDRLIYAVLVGKDRLYEFLARMFTSMALYLERMAVGVWVTGHVNAWNTLPRWQFSVFAATSTFILVLIIKHAAAVAEEIWTGDEAIAKEEVRKLRYIREVLAVDNEDLDEDEARRLEELLEILERIRKVREGLAFFGLGVLAEKDARQRRRLRGKRRPRRARRQRIVLHDTILRELRNMVLVWSAWLVVEGYNLLFLRRYAWPVPWRHLWLRWHCPEFVALWPEDLRAAFYAAALTRTPPLVLTILVKHGLLRCRDHVDMWRKAGLSTDFVLRGEASVGLPESGALSVTMVVLGEIASYLVHGLESVFAACLIEGGIYMIYLSWPGKTTSRKKGRRKNRT